MENQLEKIMITGSSGLVGQAVIKELSKKFFIVGLDQKKPKKTTPSNFKHFDIDFSSDKNINEVLKKIRNEIGHQIASVIHLATYYDFTGEPNPKYDIVTVQGTSKLLQGLQVQEFNVEQFIFASTLLVHEPTEPGKAINEDSPVNPKWPYPESKVKTEKVLFEKHGSIPLVILRMAGVYDDECHSLPISDQIRRIYERWFLSHFFPGNRTHGQSFVHLDDLVEAFLKTVEQRKKLPNELVLLIGEPETYSYGDLQEAIGCAIYKKLWTTIRIPERLAQVGAWVRQRLPVQEAPLMNPTLIPFADDHYEINIDRAKKFLGWTPKHSLMKTIPKMVQALKAGPVKWYQENKIDPPKWLEKRSKYKRPHQRKATRSYGEDKYVSR